MRWLRLMYAYPTQVTPGLIETMARYPQICHYIDMPLQHAHPEMLRRMKRPNDVARVRRLIADFRAAMPDIAMRTTFIVGFPGETDDEFKALLDFIAGDRSSTTWACSPTRRKRARPPPTCPTRCRRRSSSAATARPCSYSDVVRARALLRPVHRRRALRPGQRVVDVAGEDHVGVGEPRVEAGQVRRGQIGEAARHRAPTGRRPRRASGRRARPACRRRRRSSRCRRPLGRWCGPPRPARRAAARREPYVVAVSGAKTPAGQVLEARRLRHLHHRGAVPQREGGGQALPARPGDPRPRAARSRGDRRRDRAVAAVGDRQGLDLHLRGDPRSPAVTRSAT